MKKLIGVRREDKNEWERRTPVTPEEVGALKAEYDLSFVVQPSSIRVFSDDAYREAGATISDDLSACPVILGVKEMPADLFQAGKTYLFFSHSIKGQPHSMEMLARLKEARSNLIDYEKIEDEKGRRLVFFGRFAGLAGMVNGLWTLGRRLEAEGLHTAFGDLKQAREYANLAEAGDAVAEVGKAFAHDGLPAELKPLVVGFIGYGHVSQGAQELFDEIPHRMVEPGDLETLFEQSGENSPSIWKVVFREEHLVEPVKKRKPFVLQEYYDHPERYRGVFSRYLPYFSLLVNCIFWTPDYPKLITKDDVKALYGGDNSPRLKVIADITCDPGGSIECTTHCTDPGNPVFVYDAIKGRSVDGFTGNGPAVLAVDNLPAEFPKESSEYFAGALRELLPALVSCDFSKPLEELELPESLKRALILKEGRFTPPFRYMRKFLDR